MTELCEQESRGAASRRLPTVADLRAWKGRRQLTMLRYFSLDEAAAAEAAGIDIASVPADIVLDPRYRAVAPTVFSMTGQTHLEMGTPDDYLRWCGNALNRGADAVYCSGSLKTVEKLSREYFPVVGHVGLVPTRATWTGGFKAVGKTAEAALRLFEEVKAYESVGAFAVEIEVVPAEVAAEISKRVGILLWSMGAGPGCDAQYLFANDILGYTEGHVPRHARAYRDFGSEYARLQRERVAAFSEYAADVADGAFPEERHLIRMDPRELEKFIDAAERQ
ncbi:3-methyl-2-oxobutanoate hydroxymethyltransferase [Rhizobium lentis]|uniref:3-methyl-2-oxobutanoate hydroxymethyltransferase n=1 Tax=Rhizobium lentis TaxID=1138194 RepID=A0A7W8XFJ0_9HYPH|nr:3-methyl-2-oxobutanoate hydroxymethyltransferase [Rhizobium lentis]MBB5551068.1 3-methyl-2-oxobutanoate hydroxymethyltransferase [Rhizobium lentis]MBB5561603.1 3-methyl-2-oxobutanoate hydroxymethyltransferase [Rhizobium lentis]MBB5568187.1 3-methyl-2-oxobutanoate hydroxymethyltransferase [Rhizobium lentis]